MSVTEEIKALLIATNGDLTFKCAFGDAWLVREIAKSALVPFTLLDAKQPRQSSHSIHVGGVDITGPKLPTLDQLRKLRLDCEVDTDQCTKLIGTTRTPVASVLGNRSKQLVGDEIKIKSAAASAVGGDKPSVRCECIDCGIDCVCRLHNRKCTTQCRHRANDGTATDGPSHCSNPLFCNCDSMECLSRCVCRAANQQCTSLCHKTRGDDCCRNFTATAALQVKLKYQDAKHHKLPEQKPLDLPSKQSVGYGRGNDLVVALTRMVLLHRNRLSLDARKALDSVDGSCKLVLEMPFSLFLDATPVFGSTHAMMLNFAVKHRNSGWNIDDPDLFRILEWPYLLALFAGSEHDSTYHNLGSWWHSQLLQLHRNNHGDGVSIGGSLHIRFRWRFLKADLGAARKFLHFQQGGIWKCPDCDMPFSTSQGLSAKKNTAARYEAQVNYRLQQSYYYHNFGNPKLASIAAGDISDRVASASTLYGGNNVGINGNYVTEPVPTLNETSCSTNNNNVYPRFPTREIASKSIQRLHRIGYSGVKGADRPHFVESGMSLESQECHLVEYIADVLHNSQLANALMQEMAHKKFVNIKELEKGLVDTKFVHSTGDVSVSFAGLPISTKRAIFIAYNETILPHLDSKGVRGVNDRDDLLIDMLSHLATMFVLSYIRQPTSSQRLQFVSSVFVFHQRCSQLFPDVCSSLYYHYWIAHICSHMYNTDEFVESLLTIGRNDCEESLFAKVKNVLKKGSREPMEAFKSAVRHFYTIRLNCISQINYDNNMLLGS